MIDPEVLSIFTKPLKVRLSVRAALEASGTFVIVIDAPEARVLKTSLRDSIVLLFSYSKDIFSLK